MKKNIPRVKDIMAGDLFTLDYNSTVKEAVEIIRNENIRHLPVLDKGKFVGMITERTISEYISKKIYDPEEDLDSEGSSLISDFDYLIRRDYPTIYPDDTILKPLEIMIKKKIDCLPVLDEDRNLVGLVSNIDLLLLFNKYIQES